ncbi:type I restriction-modification system DNA-methyltransferase subunit M [Nonlabens ulvanivorans]|uniref:site-specific DNA-methyltransferase (adenine-specific) n=1 Tax=Nonlabens ulvanivorans TaxID=906888 RepID=A0A090WIR2_NONUL|nr:type I restriction-modification system DNA-methyltransferase subunit M [Nonlabens ulvanivorans]
MSGGGEEYKIRKKLIENNLVEAIVILPRAMFYTTDISVTLWIINKNKKAHTRTIGDVERTYRFRESEVLFLDLRQRGIPFEKKFIQFSDENITEITNAYHNWQQVDGEYKDVPEFCASVTNEEIAKKDFSLVPSKYIEFVNRDEQIDYHDKMEELQTTVKSLMQEKAQNDTALAAVFKKMGYEI